MLNLKLNDFVLTGLISGGSFSSVDTGLGEVITKVNVKALEKCNNCSSEEEVINSFEINFVDTSDYYTIAEDNVTIHPAAWLQSADMPEGIYSLRIDLDINDGIEEVISYYTYYVCDLQKGTVPCQIAKKIKNDLYNSELVPLYNSVLLALECEDCCTACNLLTYLLDKLNECRNC